MPRLHLPQQARPDHKPRRGIQVDHGDAVDRNPTGCQHSAGGKGGGPSRAGASLDMPELSEQSPALGNIDDEASSTAHQNYFVEKSLRYTA